MGMPEETFGHRLRVLREERGLSQAALAEALGKYGVKAYASTIAKMESREVPKPRVIRLNEAWAVARALDVELEDMLTPKDPDFILWVRQRDLERQIEKLKLELDTKVSELSGLVVPKWSKIASSDGRRHGEHRKET